MAREPKIESKKIRVAADARNESATSTTESPLPAVDHDLIRELARLLDETGLSEIEFERDGARVRVARHALGASPAAAARPTRRARSPSPRKSASTWRGSRKTSPVTR